ncbi:hypothetical protein Hypma_007391 [Hypsizygus marmoreus]|uniref:Integrase core domain-containing protein n=1 Tax=Hypsizygus marmoreus TaxID=39966 RepID=A0A369JT74_HYPMA|nr:hypothetical protein Hypma_007391 [Hypsizygus marmoreus]
MLRANHFEDNDNDISDDEDAVASSSQPTNNNPTGINQYKDCPNAKDAHIEQLIRAYDRQGICNRELVSEMLLVQHGYTMSPRTVSRCRKLFGLMGSGATTRALSAEEVSQLVLDQMAKDPTSQRGPKTVKEGILFDTGKHVKRSTICSTMKIYDPQGSIIREPGAKKVRRGVLTALGLHHEWSGDGHDKLTEIGFPIWGMKDKWSAQWLGLWVVPNNRLKASIAYLYLSLIKKHGGMPIQTSTDCGSETTEVFGFANALREMFSPNIDINALPAHRFLKSIHNITIERGWLCFRLQFGDNVKVFWDAGTALYVDSNPEHYHLAQWLWSKLIQAELDLLVAKFNTHVIRKDKKKLLPSGVSPNVAMVLPHKYGGEQCLQPVDIKVVDKLMETIGSETLEFVTSAYADYAQSVYASLHIG